MESECNDCKLCENQNTISRNLACSNKLLLKRKKNLELEIYKSIVYIEDAESRLADKKQEKIQIPTSQIELKNLPLSDELLNLQLPENLFSIISNEELLVAYLLQIKFIPMTHPCPKCKSNMQIAYIRLFGYTYFCFLCCAKKSLKNLTCFRGSHLNLQKSLWLVFLWVLEVRNADIARLLETSQCFISAISRRIRQVVGEDFKKDLPLFSGVVEVAEFDFIKRKIEIGKSKKSQKWVLVMVERKTGKKYVEYIPERSRRVIIPIIQKFCQPGTIIITQKWAGYGRLEDLGYCHYTYDKKQGFCDKDNKNIHISTLRPTFSWLRIKIKMKNRTLSHLQEHIFEWLWRKKNSISELWQSSDIPQFEMVLMLISKLSKILEY